MANLQDAEHLTAMVGDSIIFNCHIEFSESHPVPYVIQWSKAVRFIFPYRRLGMIDQKMLKC